jgi:hypothetical protein
MRYMLLMYRDEKEWDALSMQERVAAYQATVEYADGLRKEGIFQSGDPLHPASTATTLRIKAGRTLTTDGPFAETKEQLGGYSIIEAKNLDEAIAIAGRMPLLRAAHSIEVRPIRTGPPQ